MLWEFFKILHEEKFTTSNCSDVRKSKKEKRNPDSMMFIGTNNGCKSYVDLVSNSSVTLEDKAVLSIVCMALKSRPMKCLWDFQKQKYGTAPTIIGVHGKRDELSGQSTRVLAIQEENTITHVILDDISNCENADLQTEPEEKKGEEEEGFFNKGEIITFRGTSGLYFELLEVSKTYFFEDISEKTKIIGNFLIEHEITEDSVVYYKDPK